MIVTYGEMVDFSESYKMIKISGKVDKSNTYNGFNNSISFFINRRTSSEKTFFEFFYILAIEKIDKLIENVNRYKEREKVLRLVNKFSLIPFLLLINFRFFIF